MMEMNITAAEAMIFAVAVHEAVNASIAEGLQCMTIMETAARVDFKSDTLSEDVRVVVDRLAEGK